MDRTGQIIGNYRIDSLLGIGGMGQVFLGSHLHLDRKAAIKIMHAHLAVDPGFQARFIREARAAAALTHPNIVEIYDFGEQDGLYYLVMEAVLDGSLSTLLPSQSRGGQLLDLGLGLDLVRQAAEALAYAHSHGVVHRDIKPDNLLLKREDGPAGRLVVKVCDFGLARLVEGSSSTATGMMMGTPIYMSPEQCQGLPLDTRSDQYSLGIVLYEVVTGRRPFEGRSPSDAIYDHLHSEPASPYLVRPDLPMDVGEIIARCLAKAPEDRYPTTDRLVEALRRAQTAFGVPLGQVAINPSAPEAVTDSAADSLVGRVLQRSQIDALRDVGTVTWDYTAHHTGLGYDIVVKVLKPELAADPELFERFVSDVRLAAGLRHPNIIEVRDTGVVDGVAFVALDAVGGRTLRDVLLQRRLNQTEAMRVIERVASALDYAHQRGIATRDVRPRNVRIRDDGTPVLLDFGDLTLAEELMRSAAPPGGSRVAYVAPERLSGGPFDARVDVYALGCLAYELLAGVEPFRPRAEGDRTDPQVGLLVDAPDLAPLVSTSIARALSRDPDDRFSTAGEFARVLGAAVSGSGGLAQPAPVPAPVVAAQTPPSTPVVATPPPVTPATPPPASLTPPPTVPPPGAPEAGEPAPLAEGGGVSRYGIGLLALLVLGVLGAFWWSQRGGGGSNDENPTSTLAAAGATSSAPATVTTTATITITATPSIIPATETALALAAASATAQAAVTPTPSPSPTATESPTPAPTPTFDWVAAQRNGLIFFTTGRRPDNTNIPDIWVMNADGSDQRRLFTFEGADSFPSGSAAFAGDGVHMVVTSNRDGNNEIYVINVDGTGFNNLTKNLASDDVASWSPDAQSIVFQSTRDGNVEIYVMEASGANPVNLSNNPATDWGGKFSPDGSRIAFVSDRNGTNQIFIMNRDGSEQHPITAEPGAQDYNPAWSPDGGTIAFARNTGNGFHIFLMNADGSNVRQITDNPGDDATPTWSPDGTQILFRGTRDGNADVYIMNADGSNQRRLTDNPTYDGSPVWPRVPNS